MLGFVVEGLAEFAAVATWSFAVYADVKELTVLRIGIPRMGQCKRFVYFGAVEFEELCGKWIQIVL